MGFGGSAGAMNTILKNNKNMLSKRKTFENGLGTFGAKRSSKLEFKKASPQLLRQIERRMTEERQRRETRIIIAFVAVMLLLTACLLYLEGNYNEMLTMLTK